MNITSHSISETEAFAARFLKTLRSRGDGAEAATVVGLYGDLGSGKTAFSKAVAATLGVSEVVTSPTFIIMKRYEIRSTSPFSSSWKHLIHIDAYRLESEQELLHLGWNELITNPENLILLEWPEKVSDSMPKDHT